MYVDCFSVCVWVGFGCCREILSILTYNRVKSAMGSRWFYTGSAHPTFSPSNKPSMGTSYGPSGYPSFSLSILPRRNPISTPSTCLVHNPLHSQLCPYPTSTSLQIRHLKHQILEKKRQNDDIFLWSYKEGKRGKCTVLVIHALFRVKLTKVGRWTSMEKDAPYKG